MDDESRDSRAEYFRGVAKYLRNVATQQQYDLRRADQLRALADGFDRFADRIELQVADE